MDNPNLSLASTLKSYRLAVIGIALGIGILAWLGFYSLQATPITRQNLVRSVGQIVAQNTFPEKVMLNLSGEDEEQTPALLEYTLDEDAQKRMDQLLQMWKPDYAAFVALDPETGRILTLSSFTRNPQDDLGNLALKASFPAASLFKIVTATAAIDQRKVAADSVIAFNGRFHTLYRRQVFSHNDNRWTRYMSLREAFGRSVNTIFGKLGVFYVGPYGLREYASRYGFDREIHADLPLQVSTAYIPDDDRLAVAETASGFTTKTTLSPLQAAMMAASVVNEGVTMAPYLINSVYREDGTLIFRNQPISHSVVMSKETASELRTLMEETVFRGTSRSAFKSLVRSPRYRDLEVGGKTGSLTGKNPFGKCDWFIGYASMNGHKIAVASLTVHKRYWRVKSARLAKDFIRHYYNLYRRRNYLAAQ